MADEYGSRANKLEADQKDARRQAITSSEKTDELRAANARLGEQVTDKDVGAGPPAGASPAAGDRPAARAPKTAKGKALAKRVDRILARDAAAERAEAPQTLTSQSPDAGPRRR